MQISPRLETKRHVMSIELIFKENCHSGAESCSAWRLNSGHQGVDSPVQVLLLPPAAPLTVLDSLGDPAG